MSQYELSRETVKEVIARLQAACWNFRKPDSPEDMTRLIDMWHRALKGRIYPPNIYLDAVDSWVQSAKAGSPPPYPGDILDHCRVVISRIERDPSRREGLEAWREGYRRWKEQANGAA